MTREEFERKKADSAKRIREMYAGRNMPPYPDFVKVRAEQVKEDKPDKPKQAVSKKMAAPPQRGFSAEGLLKSLNIEQIIKNPESLFILGLIILLISDGADQLLILALIFIML